MSKPNVSFQQFVKAKCCVFQLLSSIFVKYVVKIQREKKNITAKITAVVNI